jgi:hypothetical protein
LTASICLDFAQPTPFSELESRPYLVLAPARTWHTSVGVAMWQQAKNRAEEIGSMVLWCDGGEGGVSGVGGGGIDGITQSGQGSWTRTIGAEWPFRTNRTIYAKVGDLGVIVFIWVTLGVAIVASLSLTGSVLLRIIQWINERLQSARLVATRQNRRAREEETGPLIDV